MRVQGLNGRTYKWKLPPFRDDGRPRSSYHKRARAVINRTFPSYSLLEEVPIPGSRMRADFYLPQLNLMVEVHGPQHYSFTSFFYKDKGYYLRALRRDREKERFCEINEIGFVVLPYNQTDEEWGMILAGSGET